MQIYPILADQTLFIADSPTFAGLTVDSPTLVVDSVNRRVGIGTATPAEALDLASGNFLTLGKATIGGTSNVNIHAVMGTSSYTGAGPNSWGAYFIGYGRGPLDGNKSVTGGEFIGKALTDNFEDVPAYRTSTVQGGKFQATDFTGKTYTTGFDGKFDFKSGYFNIPDALGTWTSNPTIQTTNIYIGPEPTGYGTAHTHYSIYSEAGNNYFGGNVSIGASLTVDTDILTVDAVNRNTRLNTSSSTRAFTFGNRTFNFIAANDDASKEFAFESTQAATTGSVLNLLHSKDGSTLTDEDYLGQIRFAGWDGDEYVQGGNIIVLVDGTPSDGVMPTAMTFNVGEDDGSLSTELSLRADDVRIQHALKIGANLTPSETLDVAGNIIIGDGDLFKYGTDGDITHTFNGSNFVTNVTTGTPDWNITDFLTIDIDGQAGDTTGASADLPNVIEITGGVGGKNTGSGTGYAGAGISFITGGGGAEIYNVNAHGGDFIQNTGAGGISDLDKGGRGGNLTSALGDGGRGGPGMNDTAGDGGSYTWTAGDGGRSTGDDGGDGGSVGFTTGDGGDGGTGGGDRAGSGGDFTITLGSKAAIGSVDGFDGVFTVGDGSSNVVEIGATGDVVFTGGAGLVFGSFYGDEIGFVVAGGTGTYSIITDADITAGQVHNTTFQGNQELDIGAYAGMYNISYSISAKGTGAGKHIIAAIGVDVGGVTGDVAQVAGRSHIVTLGSSEMCLAGCAVLDLSANDEVSVMVTNETDGSNITVEHVTLCITQIGGT